MQEEGKKPGRVAWCRHLCGGACGGAGFQWVRQGDTTAPAAARGEGGAGVAQARFGAVDCREVKCIALTFDAGPSENSARLLDVLKEKRVPATFFLLGKRHIEKYPELVARMAAEGHEVASHTWDHKILTRITPAQIRDELERTDTAIERITGKRPTLMRPPQGRTNDTVHKICRELGLSEVLWSVTAKDYATTDSALITKRVLAQASRDGIILHHPAARPVPGHRARRPGHHRRVEGAGVRVRDRAAAARTRGTPSRGRSTVPDSPGGAESLSGRDFWAAPVSWSEDDRPSFAGGLVRGVRDAVHLQAVGVEEGDLAALVA